MGKYLGSFFPIVILATSYFFVFSFLIYRRWKTKHKKNPLTIKLLRAPGESLKTEIEDLTQDIMIYIFFVPAVPFLFVCMHLSQSYIGGMPETIGRFLVNFFGMLFVTGYLIHLLSKKVSRRAHFRLGYDAERATGQELNGLLAHGYKVFHDIPGDKFNIDHVVVGPNGVFIVETKGRAKNSSVEGADKATITYDGNTLKFPTWTETKPIEQAKWNAKWLSKELSSAVGETLKVEPVLSIPGWFVERKSNASPRIYNGKNPEHLFLKYNVQSLSEQTVSRIIHQLERLVNDVQPQAYQISQ